MSDSALADELQHRQVSIDTLQREPKHHCSCLGHGIAQLDQHLGQLILVSDLTTKKKDTLSFRKLPLLTTVFRHSLGTHDCASGCALAVVLLKLAPAAMTLH